MQLTITTEKREEIERIQQEFRRYLSPEEITRASSTAINGVLNRAKNRVQRLVAKEYTVSAKYMGRMLKVNPRSRPSTLWGGIEAYMLPIPLIAFPSKQRGSSVAVTMHKGRPSLIRNAFIATVRGRGGGGPHTGIFSRGHYEKGAARKFYYYTKEERRRGGIGRTSTGKVRITQRMGTSPLSMVLNDTVRRGVVEYIDKEAAARVQGILTSRVKKIRG